MSEGGFLAWKRQEINSPPIADYSSLKKPIQLPKGSVWHLDPKTKEWKVIKVDGSEDESISHAIPVAVPIQHAEARIVTPSDSDQKFISHIVQKHDTMQGLCLRYNITPRQLCQANHFSGTNLSLAPSTLMIPTSGKSIREPQILTPKQAQESKINSFLHRFRSKKNEIGRKEAVAYLEICDWSLEEAIQDAMDDLGWESGDLYSEKRPLI